MNDGGGPAGWRQRMVDRLQASGVVGDDRVEQALRAVPRHRFVPGVPIAPAYQDRVIQTRYLGNRPCSGASQPSVVARVLHQLDVKPGQSVLEIGSGTGYQAALLAHLVGPQGHVVTVDIDRDVADETRTHLADTGVDNVEVVCTDGAGGWAEGAPYDRIIVAAAASDLAPAWIAQLSSDGCLVVPLSLRGVHQCVAFTWIDGHLESGSVSDATFMPLRGMLAADDRFWDIPGWPGLTLISHREQRLSPGVVAAALRCPGTAVPTGVAASPVETFTNLRRWVALHEEDTATLVRDRAVPERMCDLSPTAGVADTMLNSGITVILGGSGFAAVDHGDSPPARFETDTLIPLAVRPFADAEDERHRLEAAVRRWAVSGRPAAGDLHITAYPVGCPLPAADHRHQVQRSVHTTFVTRWAP